MAYATALDVQERMASDLTDEQFNICFVLLEDVAVLIDAYKADASDAAKKVVSCSVVSRALSSTGDVGIPVGATQGSASAMGYSQSWTITNGATGELYLSRTEKKMLGAGNSIGSHSPLEDMGVDA